jgi:hypothetical protein
MKARLAKKLRDFRDGHIEPGAAGTDVEKTEAIIEFGGGLILRIDDEKGRGDIGLKRSPEGVDEKQFAQVFARCRRSTASRPRRAAGTSG